MTDLDLARKEAVDKIKKTSSLDELEQLRVDYLGKSGVITSQMKQIGSLPPEERKSFGAEINKIKQNIAELIDSKKATLEIDAINEKLKHEKIDITQPARSEVKGKIHPISQMVDEVMAIFGTLGFERIEGPEIECDFHNFTALNVPKSHPARQMHDTFYLNDEKDGNPMLLRTHTSSVQIRGMKAGKPPYKFVVAGRTFRCDSDMTHTPMFHQLEGIYIDRKINMGHLKGCINEFVKKLFEVDDLPTRFRPSYFPFTEPSAEVDIGCMRKGNELIIGKGSGWLEIMGSGMVHPNVLRSVGVDPEEWQGFAFGMGIERLAMLKYGIHDLRHFFDSDIRWLNHYGFNTFDIPSLVGGLSR